MTDIEIDEALALAIGWELVQEFHHVVLVRSFADEIRCRPARIFSHKDWNVIGPIAAKYNCFPSIGYPNSVTPWEALHFDTMQLMRADTPQKAIALAVMGAKK
jgi:hypothetical protein